MHIKKELSHRENEVCSLVAQGLSNVEMSKNLGVSYETVKVHLRNIYCKTGIKDRTNLAINILNESQDYVPSRYRELFENSPISLWEEDFSEVKLCIDRLKESGVEDFKGYFTDNPEEVVKCAKLIKILDVNKATIVLFKAKDKESFFDKLWELFDENSFKELSKEIVCFSMREYNFSTECFHLDFEGNKIFCRIEVSIEPEYRDTWERVLVAITDSRKW